jgi:hypothetical protein
VQSCWVRSSSHGRQPNRLARAAKFKDTGEDILSGVCVLTSPIIAEAAGDPAQD